MSELSLADAKMLEDLVICFGSAITELQEKENYRGS